jgi:hypothetical protein
MEDDLVVRDYANANAEAGDQGQSRGGDPRNGNRRAIETEAETDDGDGEGSSSRTISPNPSRNGSNPDNDLDHGGEEEGQGLIPPKSIHDDYLSKYIEPIRPRPGDDNTNITTPRPSALRSTSTPAPNVLTSPISLTSKPSVIPLRGLGFTPIDSHSSSNTNDDEDDGRGKPIFEIFNAELSQGSEGMVRALKGHLEDVLRVQEKIGRMHLELEGLGGGEGRGDRDNQDEDDGEKLVKEEITEGSPVLKETGKGKGESEEKKVVDVLDKREKGVDELMERASPGSLFT